MPGFFTRSSFGQPQPQVAQLPFSQFGGQRPILPTDTTGGLPFPDAGQPQPQPQPTASPLSPFLLPTGLSEPELDALLGRISPTKREIIGADPFFFQNQLPSRLQQQTIQPSSSLTTSDIPFEGTRIGTGGKFNPVLGSGIPLNNVNLVQSPNLSLDQNKLGGRF